MRIALLALLAAGCAPRQADAPPAPAAIAADSVRGRLEVVGSEPGTQVVLMSADQRQATRLDGPYLSVLRRLSGLEVVAWGHAEAGGYRVDRFAVRAADGLPAEDGELVREGGAYLLATQDGRRLPIAALPTTLRGREGTRVWMTGSLDRAPNSFGIIGIVRRPEE